MSKIKDYALIGNGRSAALISREGSIAWLCWPRFDSPSLFASILDDEKGGWWKIAPSLPFHTKWEYIEGTNVLQTRFFTETGVLLVTDFMVSFSEEQKARSLQPPQELIRRVECEKGEVPLKVVYEPKPNYGRKKIVLQKCQSLGLRLVLGNELITLRSDVPFLVNETSAFGEIVLKSDQTVDFSLTYNSEGPAVLPPLGNLISHKLSSTIEWWQNWSNQIKYEGPYRSQVVRSALVLKLLGFAPSGAFVAAPTTSLPYRIGGDFNWDYRYCWLRDAAFTVRALFGLGCNEEAASFVSWLLHSTRLNFPELRVLYDVYGEDIKKDEPLPHLLGFEQSRPVRIGNGVKDFFELDVYGDVIDAVAQLVRAGGTLDRETQKLLRGFGKTVCHNWQKEDTGIWEKWPPKHFTHSKVMCWVALDRLLELQKKGQLDNIPTAKFQENHQLIRKEIEEKSWNSKLQSYTQSYDGEELDATVLVMPFYKFNKASSERMHKTYQRVKEKLSPKAGLLYRYEKSKQEGEGAFGLCSFWEAEFLAKGGGSFQEAERMFKQTCSFANDLGLFSEQVDPVTGDALGNYPQAFTHVGLINAALSLEERKKNKT